MADVLKDFLVSIGFAVDDASRKQAEAAVSQSEAKLTDTTVAQLNRRRQAEDKALADRVNAIVSVGGELDAEEKAAAARFLKTQKEQADKQHKIEDEAQKKSREKRESAFKNVEAYALRFAAFSAKIALAVEASALGIVAVTDKAAKSFENLNYLAQRTGASPKAISSFAYAISQLGGTVEGATSSLDAFGQKLTGAGGRGFEQMLNNLGVKTRDAAGNLRDAGKIAGEAVQELGRRPIAESQAYAQVFGFDDLTRRAGADPRLGQFEAQHDADQAKIGADPNAAAAGGTQFEQHMRRLEDVANDVATKVETNLFKKIQPLLDKLADWIVEHGQDIATVMSDIADKLVRFATAMSDAFVKIDWDTILKSVDHFFTEFDRLARQYLGKDGVTAVFEAFGVILAVNVLGKLTGILSAMRLLGALSLPTWLLRALGVAGVGTAALAGGALLGSTSALNSGEPTVNPDGSLTYPDGHSVAGRVWNGGQEKASLWDRFKGKLGFGGKTAPLPKGAALENAKESYAFWREKGLPHYGALGMLAQEGGESNFNPHGPAGDNGTAIGSFQWHGDRRAKIMAATGIDVTDPKTTHRQMLEAAHWEMTKGGEQASWGRLQAAKSTDEAVAAGVGFERPGDTLGAIRTRIGIARGLEGSVTGGTGNRTPSAEAAPLRSLPKPQSGPPGVAAWGADSKGNPVPIDKNGRSIPWHRGAPAAASAPATMPALSSPLGITPSVTSSIANDNSRTRGDTTITHSPTFNVQGSDVTANLRAAQLAAGRGVPDWLRNMQGAGQ